MTKAQIDFLMGGDPAIRWQTMKDLLETPEGEWRAEKSKVASEGWGRQVMDLQSPDGRWPKERWTDNVWTLCLLTELGMPPGDTRLNMAFEHVVSRLLPKGKHITHDLLFKNMDICHLGFWLRIGSNFVPNDERLGPLVEFLLSVQFADGGWNCRIRTDKRAKHSSFHTTFNVLEGLRDAAQAGIVTRSRFEDAEAKALEFMLAHKMYRSDKTGEMVAERFLHLSYPSFWHYTVLRGLDYINRTPFIRDPRLDDSIRVIENRQKANGLWPVEKRIPGSTLFDMERMGQDSRWNTLRALRVLKAAGRA